MTQITPRRLNDDEFRQTCCPGMIDIKGEEDRHGPGWVIDLEPYLAAIPEEELSQHPLLEAAPPAAVRRNQEQGFDHVLYPVRQDNAYLVVVVRFREGNILGHYYLNL